jgi:uncharacterized protein (DUF1684 family)
LFFLPTATRKITIELNLMAVTLKKGNPMRNPPHIRPRNTLLFLISLFLLMNCGSNSPEISDKSVYVKEIQQWQQKRLKSLQAEDSWLSLIGLFWLKEGENTFGANSTNDIVFPAGKAPEYMGSFLLENGEVRVKINPGVEILHGDSAVKEMKIFTEDMAEPLILSFGSLNWFIIKRGSQIGVRLRDKENPALKNLGAIETFAVDPAWRVEAALEPYDPPKTVQIQNVLGMTIDVVSPGLLLFELQGEIYRLETINSGDNLFIMFSDETSGVDTYGAGRYMYVKKPAGEGKIALDFNKAYSPPCAFTDYATCTLPPPQNHIPIRISAGEKFTAHHQ